MSLDIEPGADRMALTTPPREHILELVKGMRALWRRLDPTEADDDPVGIMQASKALMDGANVIQSLMRDVGDLDRNGETWRKHAVTSDKQLSDTLKECAALRSQLAAKEAELTEARKPQPLKFPRSSSGGAWTVDPDVLKRVQQKNSMLTLGRIEEVLLTAERDLLAATERKLVGDRGALERLLGAQDGGEDKS